MHSLTTILILLFVITGCEGLSNYRNINEKKIFIDYAPEDLDFGSLTGVWQSNCEQAFDPEFPNKFFKKRLLIVNEDNTFSIITRHFETSCTTAPNLEVTVSGTIEVLPSDISVQDLNLTFEDTTLTVLKEEYLATYNTGAGLCDINTWALGISQDISDKNCASSEGISSALARGTTNYNIFQIVNANLLLGDSSLRTILNENNRPSVLDLASFSRLVMDN